MAIDRPTMNSTAPTATKTPFTIRAYRAFACVFRGGRTLLRTPPALAAVVPCVYRMTAHRKIHVSQSREDRVVTTMNTQGISEYFVDARTLEMRVMSWTI